LAAITSLKTGDKVYILALFKQHTNRDIKEELNILVQKGFSRLFVNGEVLRIEDELVNEKPAITKKTTKAYILIDRIVIKDFDDDDKHRLADSIGTAFYEGEGDVYLQINEQKQLHFNNRFELDGIQFEEPVPNLFSFNNPFGACPTCEGFSQVLGIDNDLVIPDRRLSVYDGAVAPWKGEKLDWWRQQFIKGAKKNKFSNS
jgi:excinuclease ABC subunit A